MLHRLDISKQPYEARKEIRSPDFVRNVVEWGRSINDLATLVILLLFFNALKHYFLLFHILILIELL